MITRLIRRVMTWKKYRWFSRRSLVAFGILLIGFWVFCRNVDVYGFSPRQAEVRRIMNTKAKEYGYQYGDIRGPLTVEEVEQELFRGPVDVADTSRSYLAQEFKRTWIQFKSSYEEGDELYFYRSDKKSWSRLAGREGYALVRQDEIVGKIVVAMN